ncbi:head-tail joining protein [Magnetococcus sp. PR-3]|uniref:head-tail joining protein n=1 Tax=Magnetococcus sp. PR-3 TaxID=3120355 RepID=UPI002FCE2487
MNPFSMAVDATFQSFGIPVTYRPSGGDPVLVSVISKRPDEVVSFGETRIHAETSLFEVRTSEVANPQPDDQVEVNGVTYIVQGEPMAGRDRLVWTLDCYPA